jgi:uncharacterized protein (DUF433 family)
MLAIKTEPAPLTIHPDGVIRVGGTRVTLDTVVAAFADGLSAEEIVYAYSSVQLADVYAVIGYYLRNRAEVETYLEERRNQAEAVRRQNEARFDPQGIRARLLARKTAATGGE